ncbi:hypothetical protein [Streptomyces sp. NPDC051636]|uniref:hypothetical protein n=1 Tax=Streptomyces sp. NPDC051636 TaxID=3365663 RepID=UPI0037B89EA7
MFRGTTARTVLALLTAALLTLQLFAPGGIFASAHTSRQVEAKAPPGIKPSPMPLRDDSDTFRDLDSGGDPSGPPQTRDRHRTAASGWAHERPLPIRDPAAAHPAAAPRVTHHRTARSGRALSPAALQVFRC